MSDEMTSSWVAAVDELAADRSVRAVVVTGEGSAFCSGGNTSWIASEPDASVDHLRTRMIAFYRAWLSIRRLEVPTIAAVNGAAIGAGLCLALACDIRYAAAGAKLGAPFVKLGMHPGMAATYLLPNVVGEAHARELLLTGRVVDADEALRLGLVSRVGEPASFLDEVLDDRRGDRGHRADREQADQARAARRRPRRRRGLPAVGGDGAADHARDRRPAGGHPGGPGEAGAGLHRQLSAGAKKRPPRRRPDTCLPLASVRRRPGGLVWGSTLGAGAARGQRGAAPACGQRCGQTCG